jgi:archaemetzincin
MAADVFLWWIGSNAADDTLMHEVRSTVERAFRLQARLYHHSDRPTHAFDVRRGQHSSTQILRWLVARDSPKGRVVVMTDADLFIPVLTFVYGEAQLGGRGAVVSTARLGLDVEAQANPRIVVDRTITETIHELGHSFGLLHCDTPGCVMTRSVSLADVDNKGAALCGGCDDLYAELRRKEGHHE